MYSRSLLLLLHCSSTLRMAYNQTGVGKLHATLLSGVQLLAGLQNMCTQLNSTPIKVMKKVDYSARHKLADCAYQPVTVRNSNGVQQTRLWSKCCQPETNGFMGHETNPGTAAGLIIYKQLTE